jgi:uncharacterized membrane protein YdjX (TVP38/TMEM64 family)
VLVRCILFLALLALLGWAGSELLFQGVKPDLPRIRALIESWGPWGPLASLGLMTLQSLISPIPFVLVVITNGALFGVAYGLLLSCVGEVLGASAAYALARMGFAPAMTSEGVKAIRGRLSFWHLLSLRLVPGLSVDLVSYACGALAVPWGRFVLSTVLGLLPRTLLFSYFGEEVLANPQRTLVIGLVIVLPVWLYLAWKWKGSADHG